MVSLQAHQTRKPLLNVTFGRRGALGCQCPDFLSGWLDARVFLLSLPFVLPRSMGLACLISLFNPERPDKVRSRAVGPASPLGQYRNMHVLDPSLLRPRASSYEAEAALCIHSCQLCTILARVNNPVHAMPPAYLLPPPLPTSIFAKMGCGDTHSLGSPGGHWLDTP